MWKYLLYKPNKNFAEIPNGCHNIAVSLGDGFLAHPVYQKHVVSCQPQSKMSPTFAETLFAEQLLKTDL